MTLNVKYFGAITDVTGKNEETFQSDSDVYLKEMQTKLEEQYPKIKSITYSIAVNQTVQNGDVRLNDNDELALLPPFAGG
jgi:molybdopterin synthase sulfur carrier subunit